MARLPFSIPFEEALASGGTITFEYQAPTNQQYEIHGLMYVSTGGFDITDLYDSEGNRFTNATVSNGIDSGLLLSGGDDNNGINPFSEMFVLEGGRSIHIQIQNTSLAANTVNMVLFGILIRP